MKRWNKHGMSATPTYGSWKAMIQRCCNPKFHRYPEWGGKGVTVCEKWMDFRNFLADMGERPAGTTLDRRRSHEGYTPSNCRWATPVQQQETTSKAVLVTRGGVTRTLGAWAREIGIPRSTIYMRVVRGASPEEALTREGRTLMARTPKTVEAPAEEVIQKQPRFKFKKDDPVRRVDGASYAFPGIVLSAYRELNGQPRYVVACTAKVAYNLQHIFNGDQLEKIEPKSA